MMSATRAPSIALRVVDMVVIEEAYSNAMETLCWHVRNIFFLLI
jgi:hypothetical protein